MENPSYSKFIVLPGALVLQGGTSARAVGAVVGSAATVAVETAKVPVKANGAVVDVVTDEDDD